MSKDKVTTATIRQMKAEGKPITMLTAYDFSMAKLVDDAGIDMILVGDSLGMVMLGYDSTLPVTMDEMIHHTKAVCRGASRAMVVADLPFMSYQVSVKEALRNSGRIMKETSAQAVKVEGGQEFAETFRAIVNAGIPVVGHLGLTPQSVHQMGGYKVQGKDESAAKKLLADAKCVEEAGAFCLVLECVPSPLAKLVTESLQIPTIGIGAGPQCDGQVLVIHDMLGLYPRSSPKFVKKYVNLHEHMTAALKQYIEEVAERTFPGPEHSFGMSEEVLKKLY